MRVEIRVEVDEHECAVMVESDRATMIPDLIEVAATAIRRIY